ncbi:hypothetical protein BGZ97_004045 [Linnemannia gamsii]|uniref:Uncharacterized protein n=1 Tax=Linnemannia gamsii TaxID=64522 RepID=A0A9P6QSA9_9FUNG|nr:hypothetical protein BGZ97_004045 [Linnemannia gamsii]
MLPILDACLEDAFEPLLPVPLENDPQEPSEAGAGSGAGTAAARAVVPVVGRSLITNLESLTVMVFGLALDQYFPDMIPKQYPENLFSTTANVNNHNNDEAMIPELATEPNQRNVLTIFKEACLRLILCNPRLRTLECTYAPQVINGLEAMLLAASASGGSDVACNSGGRVLRSLKSLSIVTSDGQIPASLPPSVTSLLLQPDFGTLFKVDATKNLSQPTINETLEVLEMGNIESDLQLKTILTQAPALKILNVNAFSPSWRSLPPPPAPEHASGTTFSAVAPVPTGLDAIAWPLSRVTVLKFQHGRGGRTLFSPVAVPVYGMVPVYNGMFQSFPFLVEYHDDIWTPALACQLVENCPLMEVVRIRQGSGYSFASPQQQWQQHGSASKSEARRLGAPVVDSVSRLLSSLSRLRVLEIPKEVVKAEKILESPWVCLGLEEFWCQIVELPFLTKEEELQVQEIRRREVATDLSDQHHARTDKEDELMEHNERCISTRKHIMAQLSKLTSLKYLSLSPDFRIGDGLFEHRLGAMHVYKSERDGRSYIRYDDVLPDTLHFRLDMGLDQLATLKKLEYLSIESMDHRLDIAEIEWIAKEFPRLREMRGLVKDNFVGIEPDPKMDALVALIRRLRTDVAQRQSFNGYSGPIFTSTVFGSGLFGTITYNTNF